MTPIQPIQAAPTGSLAGPAVAVHDIDLNDNDVETPLKPKHVGEQYQQYYRQTGTVVEQTPSFNLLDCLVCWYCPGVFLISRLCCPPPPDTTVRRIYEPVPGPMAGPMAGPMGVVAQGVPVTPIRR